MDKVKLFDIPGLSGYKSLLSGWGLILLALAQIISALGSFLAGEIPIVQFVNFVQSPLLELLAGIGVLGIGHKVEKVNEEAKKHG